MLALLALASSAVWGSADLVAALSSGTMGVIAPIASLGVVVPVLLGLASGERPSAPAWVGMAVAVAGVTLASGPELWGGVSPRPLPLAVTAAVGFGFPSFCLDLGARISLVATSWGMRTATVVVVVAA